MAKQLAKKRKHPAGVDHPGLERINLNAAGIDIGADFHWVALPTDRPEIPVLKFGVFPSDLHRMAAWLLGHGIDTVVIDSTGVYWIALFQGLERRGLEVKLVNARHVKNSPGRQSDLSACRWLQ
jgi:transposase